MAQSIEEKKEKAKYGHIRRTYGITPAQYKEILNDNCPLCTKVYTPKNPACVDHDHSTGEIRGIVCRDCNHRIIGRLRDHHLVQRLANYLTPPFTGWIVPPKRKKRRKVKKPRIKSMKRILDDSSSDPT